MIAIRWGGPVVEAEGLPGAWVSEVVVPEWADPDRAVQAWDIRDRACLMMHVEWSDA